MKAIGKTAPRVDRPKATKKDSITILLTRGSSALSRAPYFGDLVLAVREDDAWRYVGQVGTGFSRRVLKDLHAADGS